MVIGTGFSNEWCRCPWRDRYRRISKGCSTGWGRGAGTGRRRDGVRCTPWSSATVTRCRTCEVDSPADAGVFWHAGSVLALPEAGLPSQYPRLLAEEEFGGGLTVPIASHVHRVASDGARVLFSVDDGLGVGDDADAPRQQGRPTGSGCAWANGMTSGGLRNAQSIALDRATWQHDIGVTEDHVVFIESPTRRLELQRGGGEGAGAGGGVRPATMSALRRRPTPAVPFGWVPSGRVDRRGAPGRRRLAGALVPRRPVCGHPCTRCVGRGRRPAPRAERRHGCIRGGCIGGPRRDFALVVCRYDAPEPGQLVDLGASVVGPAGIGRTPIGGSLAVLERWRLVGDRLERQQLDDRHVEYPRMDQTCEGQAFRYGYAVEFVATPGTSSATSGSGST